MAASRQLLIIQGNRDMSKTDMGCRYTRQLIITPSMCDSESKLSIPAAFDLFQDTATLHADYFEIGPEGMNRRNYFWVITKTVMKYCRMPSMMEEVEARTWIQPADRAKCERDFALYSGDELLLECRSIWAVMSHDTGRLVPMAGLYPEIEFDEPAPDDIGFDKISKDFDGCETIGTYTVRSVDIDLGGHMNNVNYIRAALGCFSSEQLRNSDVRGIEVQYISQTYEGGTLTFRKRPSDGGFDIGAFNDDGKAMFLARINS